MFLKTCFNPQYIYIQGMTWGYAGECSIIDKKPNADTSKFFDLLKDSNKPLWDGCTNYSKLLVVALVFTIKLDYGLSEASYDRIVE